MLRLIHQFMSRLGQTIPLAVRVDSLQRRLGLRRLMMAQSMKVQSGTIPKLEQMIQSLIRTLWKLCLAEDADDEQSK